MENLHEYKCPNCGSGITFSSQLQKMKCPACGTEFDMEALRSFDEALTREKPDDMQWDTSRHTAWTVDEETRLRTYVCNSCGGAIMGDETLAATSCPYCGNPVIMMQQFAGSLRPDLVIPFKFDKEAAKQKLLKHYEGKKLLPDVFKDQNHIDEIKGLYVPFWLYDADADANIRYRATRVHSWSDRDYIYTETQFYTVLRGGSLGFSAVPVDGSSKMPNDLMESLEPFDLSQAVDFQTAYLSGFLADKYDEDAEQCIPRANARVKQSTEDAFASTVQGYATVKAENSSVSLHNGKARYALYPVWLLNTTWNGQKYTFAMNGQTGKFVGNLPIDKGKKWRYRLLWTAVGFAISYSVAWLLWLLGIL